MVDSHFSVPPEAAREGSNGGAEKAYSSPLRGNVGEAAAKHASTPGTGGYLPGTGIAGWENWRSWGDCALALGRPEGRMTRPGAPPLSS
eukprot:8946248-Heterocapsa_arctica.AAC.1